jgi:hypothetical protein
VGDAYVTPKAARTRVVRFHPAFYASTGSLWADLWALVHLPYTAWHLSYVVFGAALASEVDRMRLGGTLLAFAAGTGVAAHALDEWNGRPLRTSLSDRALVALGVCGVGAGAVAGVAGTFIVSPWALFWAAAGTLLMLGYVLEWHSALHTDFAFGLTWGAFPVLVGYWAQTEQISLAAVLVAAAATLLSLAQRALSTPARYVRRHAVEASALFDLAERQEVWGRERLLNTWETPLKLLAAAAVVLAVGLLVAH